MRIQKLILNGKSLLVIHEKENSMLVKEKQVSKNEL